MVGVPAGRRTKWLVLVFWLVVVALAVRLAELPDVVRGYEDVKMRTVESYHQSLAELRAQLDDIPADPP